MAQLARERRAFGDGLWCVRRRSATARVFVAWTVAVSIGSGFDESTPSW
jgi:hypothetical protein